MPVEIDISRFEQQLQDMLIRQQHHNLHVHEQWQQQNYPFCRAIWMECAELIDHFGWKWWKQQTTDMNQVYLEIVDIWHFGLSHVMVLDVDQDEIVTLMVEGLRSGTPPDLIESVEVLASHALDGEFNLHAFARLLNCAEMSLDLLYAFYLGKNALNIFRQLNGYKEGSYLKYWSNNKEDNHFLVKVLVAIQHQKNLSERLIMSELAAIYPGEAVISEST